MARVFGSGVWTGGDSYDDWVFDQVEANPPGVGRIDGRGAFDTIIFELGRPVTLTRDPGSGILATVGAARASIIDFEAFILDGSDDTATLYGMDDWVEVHGGDGADVLSGSGALALYGDGGDDRITLRPHAAPDSDSSVANGGQGNDTLVLDGGFTVDLALEVAEAGLSRYTVRGFERVEVVNGFAADISGDDGSNVFFVAAGASAGVLFDGRAGDDQLFGGMGSDILLAGDGDDILSGSRGNDLIDGGAGQDRLVYDGLLRQYVVHTDMFAIAKPDGAGLDTISNIELIEFRDGVLSLNENDAWAQVVRIYDTVLQRQPDPDGLEFHTGRIASGQRTLLDVATDFLNSPEFQAATGGLGNQQFARFIYQTALDREPDAEGLAYWTGQLDGGVSRASMLVLFSEGSEHRALTAPSLARGHFTTDVNYQDAALIYDTGLGRLPDADGINYWGDALRVGQQTTASMSAAFADSAEFQTRTAGFSNGQLVDYMYQNTLDRQGDAGGKAYWTAQLDAGLSKADLLTSFAFSAEHRALLSPYIDHGIVVL